MCSPVALDSISPGYGVIELTSDFSFGSTIERLRQSVLSQGDTKWFGEVDFLEAAKPRRIEVSSATLLLFGGPGPGGRAMAQFPKLGLDAFCQKVLVYQDGARNVKVAFNDIVAFAELHYGQSAPPHKVIDDRLKETFSLAVRKR